MKNSHRKHDAKLGKAAHSKLRGMARDANRLPVPGDGAPGSTIHHMSAALRAARARA